MAETEKTEAENEKKPREKKEIDLTKHKVDSIVNVVPLEPCVVWVAISDTEDEKAGFKSIGIPGFYDPKSKRFITLDGGRVAISDFDKKLEEYVNELDRKIAPQAPPAPEGFGG